MLLVLAQQYSCFDHWSYSASLPSIALQIQTLQLLTETKHDRKLDICLYNKMAPVYNISTFKNAILRYFFILEKNPFFFGRDFFC